MRPYLSAFLESGFSGLTGLTFLFGKIAIKRIARAAVGVDFDTQEAFAWFGVDLAVLSVSLWVGRRLHDGMSYEQGTLAYIALLICALLTSWSYARYWARRQGQPRGWRREVALSGWIALGLTLGLACLIATFARMQPHS